MTDFVKFGYPVEWNDLPRYERKKKIKELKRETQAKSQTFKKVRKYIWIGIVIILLVAGYKWIMYKSPKQIKFEEEVKSASLAGKVQEFPIDGQDHVANETPVTYKTNPPTSGIHYVVPEPWGVYEKKFLTERLFMGLNTVVYGFPTKILTTMKEKFWKKSAKIIPEA